MMNYCQNVLEAIYSDIRWTDYGASMRMGGIQYVNCCFSLSVGRGDNDIARSLLHVVLEHKRGRDMFVDLSDVVLLAKISGWCIRNKIIIFGWSDQARRHQAGLQVQLPLADISHLESFIEGWLYAPLRTLHEAKRNVCDFRVVHVKSIGNMHFIGEQVFHETRKTVPTPYSVSDTRLDNDDDDATVEPNYSDDDCTYYSGDEEEKVFLQSPPYRGTTQQHKLPEGRYVSSRREMLMFIPDKLEHLLDSETDIFW